MAYALMILERRGDREARTEAQGRALYDRMVRFSEELKQRGQLTLSQSLKTDAQATRIARREQQWTVHDGPFAEAREMVGGFFLLTVESREAALAIARQCPAAEWATVEVREMGPCFS
jgi:hypothetical protein